MCISMSPYSSTFYEHSIESAANMTLHETWPHPQNLPAPTAKQHPTPFLSSASYGARVLENASCVVQIRSI